MQTSSPRPRQTPARDQRPARRPLPLAAVGLLCAAVLSLVACGDSSAPTATQILQKAQAQWSTTTTLHFIMTVTNPGTGTIDNPYPTAATGDVKRPDAMAADATVDVGGVSLSTKAVIVNSTGWYLVPIINQWQQTDEFNSFLLIFDSQKGLGALLTQLKNPSKPADGSANGTPCWKISGTLDPALLTPLFGSTTATAPVPTTFCIAKSDNRLASAALTGTIITGDKATTVHTFFLSKYGEAVTVTPPPGV
jgi:hypothetical protein